MCSHPDSYADPSSYLESGALELTFVDPEESHPDAESTRIENSEESQSDVESQYSTDDEESSLHDPTPAETSSSFAVTYEIVENSSKRGRPKLIESQGYSYTLQRRRGLVTEWQCSIRPKVNPCRATVRQRGDQFQCGNHVHNHQAQVGALTAAKIKSCTRVQLWCPRCKKSTEGVFLPQRPSSFIKRLFLEPLRPAFVNLDDFRSLKTALLGATTCAKVMINVNVL